MGIGLLLRVIFAPVCMGELEEAGICRASSICRSNLLEIPDTQHGLYVAVVMAVLSKHIPCVPAMSMPCIVDQPRIVTSKHLHQHGLQKFVGRLRQFVRRFAQAFVH
jgi:hypothetical protein